MSKLLKPVISFSVVVIKGICKSWVWHVLCGYRLPPPLDQVPVALWGQEQ